MTRQRGCAPRLDGVLATSDYVAGDGVTGREDLGTLEKWVTDKFSAVPNKNVPPPEARWAGRVAPIDPVKAAKETYAVVPVQDDRAVTIEWILPYTGKEERQARVEAKPQNVIGARGAVIQGLRQETGAQIELQKDAATGAATVALRGSASISAISPNSSPGSRCPISIRSGSAGSGNSRRRKIPPSCSKVFGRTPRKWH